MASTGIAPRMVSNGAKNPLQIPFARAFRRANLFPASAMARPVRRPHYEMVKDQLSPEAFDERVEATIAEWGGLLDRDAASLVVVERLGRSVASFSRIADLQEGMEASLRAEVVGLSPIREFTRQDGTGGRVVNLEVRDETGFCRFALWDDDVALVERGTVAVGKTVRALDCFVRRTSFGLEVTKGKFGSLTVEGE